MEMSVRNHLIDHTQKDYIYLYTHAHTYTNILHWLVLKLWQCTASMENNIRKQNTKYIIYCILIVYHNRKLAI